MKITHIEALALRNKYRNSTIKQAANDMGVSYSAARYALNKRKCVRVGCDATVAFKSHCPAHRPAPGTAEYHVYYL